MSTLIIGGTGRVGSLVVQELADRGAEATVLTTDPDACDLPTGMRAVKGDLLEPASIRRALDGVDTLFLLAAVSPSELTQSLIALDVAHEAKVANTVYFSQNKLDWPDCPHAAAKAAAEALIRRHGMPATILRPAYFFQNEVGMRDAILGGTYPVPIGDVGADMVDVRDIAAVAALAILDPDAFQSDPIVELVGPDTITGDGAAAIWSNITGKAVVYGGDDLGPSFEERHARSMPAWQAHDLVTMFRECQREGMKGQPGAADRLVERLGRPLRDYRSFAEETLAGWRAA